MSQFYILYSDVFILGIGSIEYIKNLLDKDIASGLVHKIITYEKWHMDSVEPESWEFAYIPTGCKREAFESDQSIPAKSFWGKNIIGVEFYEEDGVMN